MIFELTDEIEYVPDQAVKVLHLNLFEQIQVKVNTGRELVLNQPFELLEHAVAFDEFGVSRVGVERQFQPAVQLFAEVPERVYGAPLVVILVCLEVLVDFEHIQHVE